MKKTVVFFLAFLYFTSSCEATVYLHYCMGKAVGISLLPDHSLSCHRCGMKKSPDGKGCCKDEQKLIKTDKSQKLTDFPSFDPDQKKFLPAPGNLSVFSTAGICKSVSVICHPSNGPPPGRPLPAYLMNCLLLI
jgi:hypothetical protein